MVIVWSFKKSIRGGNDWYFDRSPITPLQLPFFSLSLVGWGQTKARCQLKRYGILVTRTTIHSALTITRCCHGIQMKHSRSRKKPVERWSPIISLYFLWNTVLPFPKRNRSLLLDAFSWSWFVFSQWNPFPKSIVLTVNTRSVPMKRELSYSEVSSHKQPRWNSIWIIDLLVSFSGVAQWSACYVVFLCFPWPNGCSIESGSC